MPRRFVYTLPDSSVRIRTIPDHITGDALTTALVQNVPAGASAPVEITDADIPPSREYRDAWEINGNTVQENPAKRAVLIALGPNRLRPSNRGHWGTGPGRQPVWVLERTRQPARKEDL